MSEWIASEWWSSLKVPAESTCLQAMLVIQRMAEHSRGRK